MKGMILAAGYGTRLRPDTNVRPKPLFAIGKTTMIKNAAGYLLRHGITEIAVNTHHLAHMVKEELETADSDKVKLHVIEEQQIMGTAGGIKGAQPYLDGEEFVVVNCDVLTDTDLGPAIDFHREAGALATLLLRENPDPALYGTLKTDSKGRLVRFLGTTSPDYETAELDVEEKMFTGIHIFSPEIFSHIPEGRPVDISGEVYPMLVKSGAGIYGYDCNG